eukprot:scaffold2815_cov180-Ochromonas_danica.AAC.5
MSQSTKMMMMMPRRNSIFFSLRSSMKICSPTWRRFSTVEVLEEGIPGSKHKIFFLTMPEIMEAKNGKVNKWLKKEGEAFAAKESICEVSCSGISIGFSSDKAGILIQRLVNEGQIVDIRKPIASYVLHKEAHMSYIESKHMQAAEEARMQHHEEMVDEDEQSDKKPDAMVLMREIKHLIQQGQIQEGSGEFGGGGGGDGLVGGGGGDGPVVVVVVVVAAAAVVAVVVVVVVVAAAVVAVVVVVVVVVVISTLSVNDLTDVFYFQILLSSYNLWPGEKTMS